MGGEYVEGGTGLGRLGENEGGRGNRGKESREGGGGDWFYPG